MIICMFFIDLILIMSAIELYKIRKELKKEMFHMKKTIYCGDEYTAQFLVDALEQLSLKADSEIYTIDGEYVVDVLIKK